MNSDAILSNLLRFIGIFLVQVLVLINVEINTSYVNLYIYLIFILLLPIQIQSYVLLLIAFFSGLLVDMFYDTLGIHAAASVFVAFVRPLALLILEPKGGYKPNQIPSKDAFGITWFVWYAGTLMFLHLFLVFFLEAFTFVGFGVLLLKTIISSILSGLLVLIYLYVFNPKH